MNSGGWEDPRTRTLQMLLNGAWIGHRSLLIVMHGAAEEGKVRLPEVPGIAAYELLWDSAHDRPGDPSEPLHPRSRARQPRQPAGLPRRRGRG